MHTVLVVDDNESIRRGLSLILRQSGFGTSAACDGAEALELAEAVRPDLVLLDASMPRMDGLEFLAELREHPDLAGLPVLMYSAVEDDFVQRQAARLGAGFLPKGTTSWAALVDQIRLQLPVDRTPAPPSFGQPGTSQPA